MFVNVLQKEHIVERVETPWAFLRLLLGYKRHMSTQLAIIYISLMAPFILLLKLIRPSVQVYYMVRGDEVTYVKHANRHFRAYIAMICQKLLNTLGSHFVFVSEDLRFVFQKRLGHIKKSYVLPNTLGKRLPEIRPFNGRIALVGDFGSVNNIEVALETFSKGRFEVHLYGNRALPEKWRRPWLHAHGFVKDLTSHFRKSASMVVIPYLSAGFPNVIIEALEAGCSLLVHRGFPFKYFPISDEWRFSMHSSNNGIHDLRNSDLENVLDRLLQEKRDFKCDNSELIDLIESDWEQRVWDVFG